MESLADGRCTDGLDQRKVELLDLLAVPGDDSTASETHHGNGFTVSAPGFGVLIHDAGLTYADGTHRGVVRLIEDPQVAAAVCAALTA